MLNPAHIVNALVAKLQAIPDVVRAMDNDASRISAYQDSPPKCTSLQTAIYDMIPPSLLVAHMGTEPAGDFQYFAHSVSIYIRATDDLSGAKLPTFTNTITAIMNGVPSGEDQPLIYLQLSPYLNPMNIPSVKRIHDEEGTLDMYEIATVFEECVQTNGTEWFFEL